MADYKQMYFELAGKVADAIELLTQAQLAAEAEYIEEPPLPPLSLAETGDAEEGDSSDCL